MKAIIYCRDGGIAVDADGHLEYAIIDEDSDDKDTTLTAMNGDVFQAHASLHEADEFPEGVRHYFEQLE